MSVAGRLFERRGDGVPRGSSRTFETVVVRPAGSSHGARGHGSMVRRTARRRDPLGLALGVRASALNVFVEINAFVFAQVTHVGLVRRRRRRHRRADRVRTVSGQDRHVHVDDADTSQRLRGRYMYFIFIERSPKRRCYFFFLPRFANTFIICTVVGARAGAVTRTTTLFSAARPNLYYLSRVVEFPPPVGFLV